ncbi:hypothetical protein ACWEOW_02945 [Monashia sp. NPDC004114]
MDASTQDAATSDATRNADEAPANGGRTVTTETGSGDRADSAAERLGGPSEREQTAQPGPAADRDTRGGEAPGTAEAATRERARLIAPERAESYNGRWDELKGQFVDEPRAAVRNANELVGEVLDELEDLFRRQRADLERGLDNEQTSTEDLRRALGHYRSFFDRLLSF